jgi:hypothetical protein
MEESPGPETYNPWSVVNLVFDHLAAEGLHPVLGDAGDPGVPAAGLLRALGITPAKEGSRQATEQTRQQLAQIRAVMFNDAADEPLHDGGEPLHDGGDVSHVESP